MSDTIKVDIGKVMQFINETDDSKCECGSNRFIMTYAVRKISGIMLGAGAGEVHFASGSLTCAMCGKPGYMPAPPIPFQVLKIIDKKVDDKRDTSGK